MIRRTLLFVVIVLVACAAADAQWVKKYGAPFGSVEGVRVRAIPGGGFYLCGSTSAFGAPYEGFDCWLARLDAAGNILWQRELPYPRYRTYHFSPDQAAVDVISRSGGGCALIGTLSGFEDDETSPVSLVVEFSGEGMPVWQHGAPEAIRWGGPLEYGRSLCAAPGGEIVAATTYEDGSKVFAINDGKMIWNGYFFPKEFPSRGTHKVQSFRPAGDGGYILAGTAKFPRQADEDAWVVRLSASGRSVLWQRSIGGSDDDYARSAAATPDGGFIVAGTTRSFGIGGTDAWVFKLDGAGEIVWQYAYGREKDDYAHEILAAPDGGFVVAGSTRDLRSGALNAWLLKLGPDGRVIWSRAYPGVFEASGISVEIVPSGYVLAGRTRPNPAGRWSGLVIATDANGDVPGAPFETRPVEVTPCASVVRDTYLEYSYHKASIPYPVFCEPLPWTDTSIVASPIEIRILEPPAGLKRRDIRH